jgi:hypothetical protein
MQGSQNTSGTPGSNIQCWGCGGNGHTRANCTSFPSGGKGGQGYQPNGYGRNGKGGYGQYGYENNYGTPQGKGYDGRGQGGPNIRDDEIAFGEVSVTECVMSVRCKSDQRDRLRQLLSQPDKLSTPTPAVVEMVAAGGGGGVVSGMSPGSKAMMTKISGSMDALVAGQTGGQKVMDSLSASVIKLNESTMSLKKRLETLEKHGNDERKRAKKAQEAAQVIDDDDEDDLEDGEEPHVSLRIEIAQWIEWKWQQDKPGLKEQASLLGITAQMNYKSKKKSCKIFIEAAHAAHWYIPDGEGPEIDDESEAGIN